ASLDEPYGWTRRMLDIMSFIAVFVPVLVVTLIGMRSCGDGDAQGEYALQIADQLQDLAESLEQTGATGTRHPDFEDVMGLEDRIRAILLKDGLCQDGRTP